MLENSNLPQIIKDRFSSPFYVAFGISWLIWNWRAWYITFFISEEVFLEKTGWLKIDYLYQLYNSSNPESWLHAIVLPSFSVLLVFFPIAIMDRFITDKNRENKLLKKEGDFKEIKAKRKMEKAILKEEKEVLVEKIEKIEKEKEVKEKTLSQEEIWNEEYSQLKKNNNFKIAMMQLSKGIYSYNGNLAEINTNNKALLHSNGLFSYKLEDRRFGQLTEKGKYFMKEFINEAN